MKAKVQSGCDLVSGSPVVISLTASPVASTTSFRRLRRLWAIQTELAGGFKTIPTSPVDSLASDASYPLVTVSLQELRDNWL